MSTRLEDETLPPRKDITVFEDGDVILVLPEETYVRVHSVILSCASPVFKAMFRPDTFSEGQGTRSVTSPKHITLPDDDPKSMITLCRLLHHNRDLVVDHNSACSVHWLCHHGPDSKYAAPLLVLVEKYDCAKALRFFADGFFRNTLGGQRRSERVPTSAVPAAYLLDAPPHFALHTRRWILERTSRWQDIILQDCSCEGGLWDMVPDLLSTLMQEKRKAVWRKLHDLLQETTNLADAMCRSCALDADSWATRQSTTQCLDRWGVKCDPMLRSDLFHAPYLCHEGGNKLDAEFVIQQGQAARHFHTDMCLPCIKERRPPGCCDHYAKLLVF